MRSNRSPVFHIIVLAAVAAAIALWPYLHAFGRLLPGDSGDTLLNLWFFEHNLETLPFLSTESFSGQSWFSPDFYFPVSGVRGWSDHLFLPTFFYGFFKFLGFKSVYALILWFYFTLFCNYASLRFCIWRLGRTSLLTSIVCAFAAFNHVLLAQLGHLQLLTLWFLPPLALALQRRQRRWVCIWLLFNWLVGPYIGIFSLLVVIAFFLLSGRVLNRLKDRNYWRFLLPFPLTYSSLLLIVLVFANLLIIIPYLNISLVMGARGTDEITKNLPNVWAWVSGTGRQFLGLPLHLRASGSEPFLFPGNVLFVAFMLSLIFWRNITASDRTLTKSLLVLGLSVTSFGYFTLWWGPMLFVPSVRAVNAAGRIASVLWLLSAFPLSGLTLEFELALATRWRLGPLFLAICSLPLLCISLLPKSALALDVVAWQKDQDIFRNELLREGCDILHLQADDGFPWHSDVFAMHAMLHIPGLKSVSGYSGWQPRNGWHPGMQSRDAFSWAFSNLGQRNYKSADVISSDDVLCGIRAIADGAGNVVYDVDRSLADEHMVR